MQKLLILFLFLTLHLLSEWSDWNHFENSSIILCLCAPFAFPFFTVFFYVIVSILSLYYPVCPISRKKCWRDSTNILNEHIVNLISWGLNMYLWTVVAGDSGRSRLSSNLLPLHHLAHGKVILRQWFFEECKCCKNEGILPCKQVNADVAMTELCSRAAGSCFGCLFYI